MASKRACLRLRPPPTSLTTMTSFFAIGAGRLLVYSWYISFFSSAPSVVVVSVVVEMVEGLMSSKEMKSSVEAISFFSRTGTEEMEIFGPASTTKTLSFNLGRGTSNFRRLVGWFSLSDSHLEEPRAGPQKVVDSERRFERLPKTENISEV